MRRDPRRRPLTDAELLAAARTDAAAFRALYDRYAARVLRYHERRTRDADAAHDLTAETFAQAWLARARFRDEAGGSAGPWLFAIARHVLLASVRRRALEQRACAPARARASARAPPRRSEAWLDGLDEALDDLPHGQREAIRLRVRRGPRLRRGRRRARHHPAGSPRARAPRAGRAAQPTLRCQEHPMTDLTPRLAELGDALERAARATCARAAAPLAPRRRARRASSRSSPCPGAAVAAIALISEDDGGAAASRPARSGSPGTEPTLHGRARRTSSTTCMLGRAPGDEIADWKGTRRADGRRDASTSTAAAAR